MIWLAKAQADSARGRGGESIDSLIRADEVPRVRQQARVIFIIGTRFCGRCRCRIHTDRDSAG